MELSINDSERLATLYKFGVLDTAFEERYERLTRLAAAVFGTPIALISLVDKDRQWFKSALGLTVRETPRDISFCTHAIRNTEVFVVNNALEDTRFRDNPLVTGEPHVRFYAGAPLVARNGHPLGTFCVIDRRPHAEFNPVEEGLLKDFAGAVVDFFEMQLAIRDRRAKSITQNEAIQDAAQALHRLSMECPTTALRDRLQSLAGRLKALD
ncbi:MAG: GAF domain-containing protein [Betaproteobacteria bacterium]